MLKKNGDPTWYVLVPEIDKEEMEDSKDTIKQKGGFMSKFPVRYVFTAMGFMGFFVLYSLRVNINVAIVAMVNASAVYNNQSASDECPAEEISNDTVNVNPSREGEFNWSPKLQATILGSFYYGYCITQIPGGRLAEIFSAKWVFGLGTVITSLLTLLTPLAARWHVSVLVFIRIAEGLAQGVTMPAMHSMLGRWIPDCEKSFLSTIVYSGINVGTVAAMPIAGVLCNSYIMGGWPSAFYIFGILGCVWFVFWMLLVSDTPLDHPCISAKELKYITDNQKTETFEKLPTIPWLSILKSKPFWALVITQAGQDYCFYTAINDLPTYLSTILHFEIEKNGFLTSAPYLLQTIVGCLVGYFADLGIEKNCFSTITVRKVCNTIAVLATVLGTFGLIVARCDVILTVISYSSYVAIGGFCYSGYMLSHLDLSPEYAGTLMGISNLISNLTGFIAPEVVGALTEQYQTLRQWGIVFWISIIVVLITGIPFVTSGSAEKQDWTPKGYITKLEDSEIISDAHSITTIHEHA